MKGLIIFGSRGGFGGEVKAQDHDRVRRYPDRTEVGMESGIRPGMRESLNVGIVEGKVQS